MEETTIIDTTLEDFTTIETTIEETTLTTTVTTIQETILSSHNIDDCYNQLQLVNANLGVIINFFIVFTSLIIVVKILSAFGLKG